MVTEEGRGRGTSLLRNCFVSVVAHLFPFFSFHGCRFYSWQRKGAERTEQTEGEVVKECQDRGIALRLRRYRFPFFPLSQQTCRPFPARLFLLFPTLLSFPFVQITANHEAAITIPPSAICPRVVRRKIGRRFG